MLKNHDAGSVVSFYFFNTDMFEMKKTFITCVFDMIVLNGNEKKRCLR